MINSPFDSSNNSIPNPPNRIDGDGSLEIAPSDQGKVRNTFHPPIYYFNNSIIFIYPSQINLERFAKRTIVIYPELQRFQLYTQA